MTVAHTILTPDDVQRLVQLLERQAALFSQLDQLGQRQANLIADGDAETLLGLLAQRQQVIDRLQALNGELEPYRRQWSDIWAGLDERGQQEVGSLVRAAQETLERVMASDERDRRQLASAQQRVAEELGRVKQSTTARQAYHRTGHGGAAAQPVRVMAGGDNRFTDQTG